MAFKKRQSWAGLVFEICKWRLEAPPRLNHQISIPSKGSSARWFGGSFLLHFRGHSVVNLCAYRNLYSWEIPSTKRLDCLGGLIGTPFGDDDQRFVYIKMLQFLLLGLGSLICFGGSRYNLLYQQMCWNISLHFFYGTQKRKFKHLQILKNVNG